MDGLPPSSLRRSLLIIVLLWQNTSWAAYTEYWWQRVRTTEEAEPAMERARRARQELVDEACDGVSAVQSMRPASRVRLRFSCSQR